MSHNPQRFPGYPNQGYASQPQNPNMMQQQQQQMQMQQGMMGYSNQQYQQRPIQNAGFQQNYAQAQMPQAGSQTPQFQQQAAMNQPRQYTNSQYPTQYPNQFNNSQQQPQQQFPQQPAANFGETSQIGDNNMNQMMNQNQMNPSQTMSINQHGQNSMQPHPVNQQNQMNPNVMSPGVSPGTQQVMQNQSNVAAVNQSGPSTPGQPMTPTPSVGQMGPSTPGQPMTPGQTQITAPQEPSPPPARPRNIFDELLESFEDVFARLIAKDEMSGCHDKDEVSVGVEYSVNKFISRAQVVELYFNQMIAKQSARSPQDVLTEEIKDLRAEIHRKDQWIDKMHTVAKKWATLMSPDEQPPAKRGKDSKDTHMSALENMSANPNYRKK